MTNVQMMLNTHFEQIKALLQDANVDLIVKELYQNWEPEKMRYYLASIQYLANGYIDFMNTKFQYNKHYNADQSREFIELIQIYDEDKNGLAGTEFEYSLNPRYENFFNYCQTFLEESQGSQIPSDYVAFKIEKFSPIALHPEENMLTETVRRKKMPLKMIGSGAYADVYKVKDPLYQRWVAIKRLKASSTDEEVKRFYQEFEVLSGLHSPYILQVYYFDNKRNEYMMELADSTLGGYMVKNPNLSIESRKRMAHQVLAGFRYLHSKNLLHRDISFNNILVFEFDDALILKISDLGLVKLEDSSLTRRGTSVKGTLRDPTLDETGFENFGMSNEIYSMARVLYFIMTNRKTLGHYPTESAQMFMQRGTSDNISERYAGDQELLKAFDRVNWMRK